MRNFGYNIINLIQLIRFFGLKEGLISFLKIITTKKNAVVQLTSEKFLNKIEIRNYTSDLPIFYQVFGELQYDINFYLCYKPTRVIDAGSNVGYSCLYFASTFPEARIIGIEPEKKNFLQLQKNTSNYPNVKIHNAALWYEPAILKIKDENDWSASFEVQKSELNDGELKAITIPQIMLENNFDEVDVLKIDIEGAEFDLFGNNPHMWLSKTKCLIIELHDQLRPGTSKLFFEAMAAYQWSTYIKGENIICFKK